MSDYQGKRFKASQIPDPSKPGAAHAAQQGRTSSPQQPRAPRPVTPATHRRQDAPAAYRPSSYSSAKKPPRSSSHATPSDYTESPRKKRRSIIPILLIIVGTLPLFVMVPFRRFFSSLGDNMYFIGGALIFTGILLFVSDRVRHGRKSEKTATLLDALLVGVGQAIALCPGISRSGMTITAGCFAGFERKFAVRFAFLLSIPAVLGANILTLKDALETNIDWASVPVYLIGVVVAAVSGYASIRLLRYVADKGRFGAFAYYCWAAGALTLLLTILH